MRALIIAADGFEDSELLVPMYRLEEQGIAVDIAAPHSGQILGKHGYRVDVGKALDQVRAEDYSALVIPGGHAPSLLRGKQSVLDLVRAFVVQGKTVAAICHGPQVLVSAGVMRGRRATCHRSVSAELRAAGAIYEDSEVVVDRNVVTARQPADLPAFMREMIRLLRVH
jgi:protease I